MADFIIKQDIALGVNVVFADGTTRRWVSTNDDGLYTENGGVHLKLMDLLLQMMDFVLTMMGFAGNNSGGLR